MKTTYIRASPAEVAETGFTAFTCGKKDERITGPLVARRIPEMNPKAADGPTHGTFFVAPALLQDEAVRACWPRQDCRPQSVRQVPKRPLIEAKQFGIVVCID